MMDIQKFTPTPAMRRWLYGVLIAVGALLVVLGVIDGTLMEQIDRLLMAVLMIGSGGTALANVNPAEAVGE